MPTWIALLRAVNVGGRTYKMADVRAHLTDSGLADVETWIQSGNVRFASRMRSPAKVAAHVERVLGEHAGFEVPALVLTPGELTAVHADALALPPPFGDAEGQRRYVAFLPEPPDEAGAALVGGWDVDGERAWVRGRTVHLWTVRPMHETAVFPGLKRALAGGTVRDLKVVATLAERWGG